MASMSAREGARRTSSGVAMARPETLAAWRGSGARRRTEQIERVDRSTVLPHFEVQVRSAGLPRLAHGGDDLALPDLLTGPHAEIAVVGIDRHQPVRVLDDHQQAVALLRTGEQDRALARGPHRGAGRRREIDPVVG